MNPVNSSSSRGLLSEYAGHLEEPMEKRSLLYLFASLKSTGGKFRNVILDHFSFVTCVRNEIQQLRNVLVLIWILSKSIPNHKF